MKSPAKAVLAASLLLAGPRADAVPLADGMKLGRPVGAAKNLKLDKHADKIDGYLDKGINKVAIAKLLDVSPNTLYEWLKVRRPLGNPTTPSSP